MLQARWRSWVRSKYFYWCVFQSGLPLWGDVVDDDYWNGCWAHRNHLSIHYDCEARASFWRVAVDDSGFCWRGVRPDRRYSQLSAAVVYYCWSVVGVVGVVVENVVGCYYHHQISVADVANVVVVVVVAGLSVLVAVVTVVVVRPVVSKPTVLCSWNSEKDFL